MTIRRDEAFGRRTTEASGLHASATVSARPRSFGHRRFAALFGLAFLALVAIAPPRVQAAESPRVVEHLGQTLPLESPLFDHHGRAVRLGDFFDGTRPVVLVLGYHSCPGLCSMVQSATADAVRKSGWVVGKDLRVVVLSFDPRDTPEVAARRRAMAMAHADVARDDAGGAGGTRSKVVDDGWHYLTTPHAEVSRGIGDALGIPYRYVPESALFEHPAVITLVSPTGRITRYLYGADFDARDVRLSLTEAAAGHESPSVDRVLLYCMRYDPESGRYVTRVDRVVKLVAAGFAMVLVLVLGLLWRAEWRRPAGRAHPTGGSA